MPTNNLCLLNAKSVAEQIVDPDTILCLARQHDLKEVLVIGWKEDGDLYVSGSHPKYKDMFWLLENAQGYLREDMSSK